MVAYGIVGLSLLLITQVRNVYPHLLLVRLLFSVGGAATATMVTAILPTMTHAKPSHADLVSGNGVDPGVYVDSHEAMPDHAPRNSVSSIATVTPARMNSSVAERKASTQPSKTGNSTVSGLVGMCTGTGALLALGVFLPLPALFQSTGYLPRPAVQLTFVAVACVAFAVSAFCSFGLRKLPGEEHKGWSYLFNTKAAIEHREEGHSTSWTSENFTVQSKPLPYLRLAMDAVVLGFTDIAIGLGYLGGFVARASSVCISLFIPLAVNAYFIDTGLCEPGGPVNSPNDLKAQCSRAYKLAAILTGVSQLTALLCAPVFGFLDGRYRSFNLPLLVAAASGIVGYIIYSQLRNPEISSEKGGSPGVLVVMALIGISQIGAIVCSLSMLGRGIQSPSASLKTKTSSRNQPSEASTERGVDEEAPLDEQSSLLPSQPADTGRMITSRSSATRNHLKGSIAGIYSLTGGAGILLLTKLGGFLFDRASTGAPFYMLAGFNALLFVVGLACGIWRQIRIRRRHVIQAREMTN